MEAHTPQADANSHPTERRARLSVLTSGSSQNVNAQRTEFSVIGPSGTPTSVRVTTLTPPSGVQGSDAPHLCFLHGLVGLNEHWEIVAKKASAFFPCTLLELPLLSLRGKDCSIDGATSITATFLEKHFGRPVTLVGNSFGGHVALKLAVERKELVRSLVLAGSSGLLEKSYMKTIELRPSREWLREKIGELFHDKSFVTEADLDRAHAQLSTRDGARAMVKLSRSARKDYMGEAIQKIDQPALLVWGREDIVTPPEAATEFERLLPNNRLVWLEQCGHAPMIEQPDPFAEAVVGFMRETSSGSERVG